MTAFVLIHGAGDGAWYWHLLVAELRGRDHDPIAIDLPSDDESAGLSEYADAVVDAIGDSTDLVVVGHLFGGFAAPLRGVPC
jgi:pimeloyl-ACP methyl ester carboxylesterase